ncbi:hypothetical protein Trydic_g3680 [Trypoxylus dichotomus]
MLLFRIIFFTGCFVFSVKPLCETSSFKNIRGILSGKNKENPTDIILDDCLEGSEKTRSYFTIEVTNQNVERLNRGAFANLTLAALILKNNRINYIEKHAFLNTKNVQELDLNGNKLKALFKDVLNDLSGMVTLDLSNNQLEQIEDGAFAYLVSLEELNLSNNKLKVWNPNWFANNNRMHKLNAVGNLLETLPEKSFRDMEKLSSLILRNNLLREIHPNAFDGLTTLKTLDLSVNKLTRLHEDTFAPFNGVVDPPTSTDRFSLAIYMPINVFAGLWDLYIHTNNLTYFSDKMMKDLTNTRSFGTFTFHSNPWQCACYLKIMQWADKKRIRLDGKGKGCYRRDNPVCVVPQKNPKECVENVEEDIRSLYFSKWKVPVDNFFDRNVVCNMF